MCQSGLLLPTAWDPGYRTMSDQPFHLGGCFPLDAPIHPLKLNKRKLSRNMATSRVSPFLALRPCKGCLLVVMKKEKMPS